MPIVGLGGRGLGLGVERPCPKPVSHLGGGLAKAALSDVDGPAFAGLEHSPVTAAVALDAKQAFSQGARLAAWTAAGFLLIGLLATLSLGRAAERVATEDEEHDAGGEDLPRSGRSTRLRPGCRFSGRLSRR